MVVASFKNIHQQQHSPRTARASHFDPLSLIHFFYIPNMKTAAILAAVAGLASTSFASTPQYFSLIAVDSTTPIHLRPITASSESLWIGKKTSSYCPKSVKNQGACPPGKNTNFAGGSGSLAMGSMVPGGQQVYIDRETGAVKYTIAHSADTEGGTLGGWSLKPVEGQDYEILSYKRGLVACPTEDEDVYQVFANIKAVDFSPACIGPFSAIASANKKADAWQYT